MPPDDAEGCVVMVSHRQDKEAAVQAAEQKYIKAHGYAPPRTIVIQLVPATRDN